MFSQKTQIYFIKRGPGIFALFKTYLVVSEITKLFMKLPRPFHKKLIFVLAIIGLGLGCLRLSHACDIDQGSDCNCNCIGSCGIVQCNGRCLGAPPDPPCTSASNCVGSTNKGTDCGAGCSATTPADPTCTSAPNCVGSTNKGTDCGPGCSATTPPDPTCTSAPNCIGPTNPD